MPGETNLKLLLKNMNPILKKDNYVFVSTGMENVKSKKLNPLCFFKEDEGLSLIITREEADKHGLPYTSVFKMITLNVQSSLDAVGFLAKITNVLAKHQISVNAISAYYHDHLFVPVTKADETLKILKRMSLNTTIISK